MEPDDVGEQEGVELADRYSDLLDAVNAKKAELGIDWPHPDPVTAVKLETLIQSVFGDMEVEVIEGEKDGDEPTYHRIIRARSTRLEFENEVLEKLDGYLDSIAETVAEVRRKAETRSRLALPGDGFDGLRKPGGK